MVASKDFAMLLQAIDGPVALFPCAGTPTPTQAVNPCDPDPEMLLTVTGSSGTVVWCGETWNLPGDSGVQKSVCPTAYTKQFYSGTNTGTTAQQYWDGTHIWKFTKVTGTDTTLFTLSRGARTVRNIFGGSQDVVIRGWSDNFNRVRLDIPYISGAHNAVKRYSWYLISYIAATATLNRPVAPTMTGSYTNGLTAANPPGNAIPAATPNGYLIDNSFFGSYTNAGITYSWAKGQGWP